MSFLMAIYSLGDSIPTIHPTAYVHPDAVVIGNVTLGAGASVWPGAVLRGDYGSISIGARSNIQDGAVIHTTVLTPTTIGEDCVIGHLAHLECCTVEDICLIGSGSVVLHEAVIETTALVGAAALIPNRMRVPAGALALGVPATIREGASPGRESILRNAQHYAENAAYFQEHLRRIDG